MKITPDKIEIPIPAYFKRERSEELAYWDNLMKETLAKMGVKKQSDETKYMEKYNNYFTQHFQLLNHVNLFRQSLKLDKKQKFVLMRIASILFTYRPSLSSKFPLFN